MFWRVVKWIEELAGRGCLQWFILENFPGILTVREDGMSFWDKLRRHFTEHLPQYALTNHVTNFIDVLPQNRERVFIVGVRLDLVGKLGMPHPISIGDLRPVSLMARGM